MAKKKAKRRTPPALHRHIRKILIDTSKAAKKRKKPTPYLTAYQILELLPPGARDRLIRLHGLGGMNSGLDNPATLQVALASEVVTNDVVYFRTDRVTIEIQTTQVTPSGPTCGLYRLIHGEPPLPSRRRKSSVGTP
jgi:hypothetical protein